MRLGTPLRYQMWLTGVASSMWPIRSRRTLARVISTPQRSQIIPFEANALVLAAVALPVFGRPEDLLAEETVALGLERAVVNRLGLLDFAERPRANLLRRREADAHGVEVVDVDQVQREGLR